MKLKLFILLILFSSFSLAGPDEEFHYIVRYFMLPGLEMKMKIYHNVEFEGEFYNKIDITTKTKKVFNKIFSIDNNYLSIYDPVDFSCKYHEKLIRQPNVEQELSIRYNNGFAEYSSGVTRQVSNRTMDFFSLLMYIRTLNEEQLLDSHVIIDMEGELFDVTFFIEKEENFKIGRKKILTDKVRLIFKKQLPEQLSVLDYTDIFFWKIAEEGGDKYIWIERGEQKRIIKARFSEGGSWLEAKLIEEE